MAAGDAALEQARRYEQRAREEWARAERYRAGAAGEREVAARLTGLTEGTFRLLVDRHWPGKRAANVDMILVGPPGVFVIDAKAWNVQPLVVDGHLCAGSERHDEEITKLLAQARPAEDAVAELHVSPSAVFPLMVFAGRRVDARLGAVRLLGSINVVPVLLSEPERLKPAMIRAVAEQLAEVFPEYETRSAAPAKRPKAPIDAPALFDAEELVDAQMRARMAEPVESWMTFLPPQQLALVRRRFNGPARITGAAGTGKTVVGMHRAAYLARRSTGKVLYTTFARNLAEVAAQLSTRIAVNVADRIEFTNLHRWASQFLRQREIPVVLDEERVFSRAWLRFSGKAALSSLVTNPYYWRDEIMHVIKARGIDTLDQYLGVHRHGRRTPLQRGHKEHVWQLYTEYEKLRLDQGKHDFTDLLTMALTELRREPLDPPYAGVIVDEVQDLTLVGMRLLHALAGDGPDGLLLIGDAAQSVYPGGFRLADAGLIIRGGRAEVLRTNYRNAEAILDAALQVLADGDPFEDLDGALQTGRPDVELTYRDGHVVRAVATSQAEHDAQLLNALAELGPEGYADAALLCEHKRDADRYAKLLRSRKIPYFEIKNYTGRRVDGIKIGTFVAAKGLEFKQVYLPNHDAGLHTPTGSAPNVDERALARHRLYVAMTRARDLLWLGSLRPTT
ncbi:MAG TPA: UvrD-helicase domain-containing protein [Actinocatenispora sp.]